MIIVMEVTPWHSVRAGITMFSCFAVTYHETQIFANNIFRAGGNVCEIVSALQMNLQACFFKPFLYLLPYYLQYNGNILDRFGNVCRGSYTNCIYSETEWHPNLHFCGCEL